MKKPLLKFFRLTVKLAILVGLGVGAWYGYQYYMPAEEDNGLGELPTARAAIRDITVSVQAIGVLRPVRIVEIKSRASGEILQMPVEVGDRVEAGEIIAQIDTAILDQEYRQIEADLQSAETRLRISRGQFDRARSLFEEDLISQDQLEASQQEFTNAEAQRLRSEADIELAKERLADATVRAPRAGTILNKTVEEGQIIASSTNDVSGGTTLVQMADLTELEIRTLVDEVDIGQVHPGMPVESKVEAFADDRFRGEVVMIEPQAVSQQSVTSFPVLSRIDNAAGKLLPGMNADVSIIIHRKPGVLTIPNEAVRSPDDAEEVARLLGIEGYSDQDFAAQNGDRGDAPGGPRSGGGPRDDHEGDLGGPPVSGGGPAGRGGPGGGTQGGGGQGGERADSPNGGRGRGGRPASSANGQRGGPGGGGDIRARFESATPAQRAQMIAAMRAAAETEDPDPFGIQGRREAAVVFILTADGTVGTKDIVVGGRDWEYTEVLDGVAAGEAVLLLPSTALLRSQEQFRSWAQGRAGGGILGGGGRGGPPPGRGRRR